MPIAEKISLTPVTDEALTDHTYGTLSDVDSFLHGYGEVTSVHMLDEKRNTRVVTHEARVTLEDGGEAVIERTAEFSGFVGPVILFQRVESYRTTATGQRTDHVLLQETNGEQYESHPPIEPYTGTQRPSQRPDVLHTVHQNINLIKTTLRRQLGPDARQRPGYPRNATTVLRPY